MRGSYGLVSASSHRLENIFMNPSHMDNLVAALFKLEDALKPYGITDRLEIRLQPRDYAEFNLRVGREMYNAYLRPEGATILEITGTRFNSVAHNPELEEFKARKFSEIENLRRLKEALKEFLK